MSKNRFWFLNKHIMLDSEETRTEGWKQDRFAAASEIFEKFNYNCGEALQMGDFVAIDECL